VGQHRGVPGVEGGTSHRDTTAALRPFRDTGRTRPFDVLEVIAEH
jgi:hypothetical protein